MSANNSLYGFPLYEFGNPDQYKEFLAPVASGRVGGWVGGHIAQWMMRRH
jgi:hypothetical protein